jgi:hypothetical protein
MEKKPEGPEKLVVNEAGKVKLVPEVNKEAEKARKEAEIRAYIERRALERQTATSASSSSTTPGGTAGGGSRKKRKTKSKTRKVKSPKKTRGKK